jgi:ribosome-associated toxin RatA of RatAB toxin-antitoxin module
VWKVILDYPNYPEFMPNMAKSILLDSSFLKSITINSDYEQIEIEAILNKFIINKIMGRTFYLYSVLEMPLWFDDKWSIYKIELKETYKLERELVIGSFDFCNGGWELESDIKGNTIATFPNHFDMGYNIPKTIKNIGMNYTIPRLYEAIQSRADYFMKDKE